MDHSIGGVHITPPPPKKKTFICYQHISLPLSVDNKTHLVTTKWMAASVQICAELPFAHSTPRRSTRLRTAREIDHLEVDRNPLPETGQKSCSSFGALMLGQRLHLVLFSQSSPPSPSPHVLASHMTKDRGQTPPKHPHPCTFSRSHTSPDRIRSRSLRGESPLPDTMLGSVADSAHR